jgi:hypothetical protein
MRAIEGLDGQDTRVAGQVCPTSGPGSKDLHPHHSAGRVLADTWRRNAGLCLAALSMVVLPLTLTGCGGGGTTTVVSTGKSAGPTPASGVSAAIARVQSAYGGLAQVTQLGALPGWVTIGANGKSVALVITTSGTTFNGASNGKMTITVPQGWKISVTDQNMTGIAQSLVIAAQTKTPLPSTGFMPALTGAATVHPATGRPKGEQKFSFTASQAGNYIMVSDVPGQADSGLWDHFDISATAKLPTVSIG